MDEDRYWKTKYKQKKAEYKKYKRLLENRDGGSWFFGKSLSEGSLVTTGTLKNDDIYEVMGKCPNNTGEIRVKKACKPFTDWREKLCMNRDQLTKLNNAEKIKLRDRTGNTFNCNL